MALDSRYVIAPSLQEYFVDKDSGLPLSGGQVFFFIDTARSVPKDVFEITGSPPNYTYSVLPNPVTLSAVGTFQDASGNDIIPYYFPYDSSGNIQLYYIEVYNSMGVLQFTREGWPNTNTGNTTSGEDITNFVPNGQFLLHDNIPASTANGFIANKVSQDITTIAQGGWTFERGPSSTATDFITFPVYAAASSVPSGNPRYSVIIQTTIAGSDSRKDLCLNFPNVNTFASATETYNFYFEAQSIGSSIPNVQLIVRKVFGTGGSPSAPIEIPVTSFNFAPGYQKFKASILFGTNVNSVIGTNNDDYVQVLLRLPVNGTQQAQLTDFCLSVGGETLTEFPQQTNAKQLDESTAGWFPTPDPNGFDLYLPAVLTPSGLTFSHADIGKIYAAMYATPSVGELYCDGTKYLTEDYSSDRIPYARLQSKWFDTTYNINLFNNGSNYMAANYTNVNPGSNTFRLNITSPGAGTIADVNTTFTFSPIITGLATGVTGYVEGGITVIDNVIGARAAPTAGTSGFTVVDIRNTTNSYHIFSVSAASVPAAGTYFTFASSVNNFYVWFKVNGSGADPAPGGVGIEVDLLSTYANTEVDRCILDAVSGYQTSLVSPIIGSSVIPGSYFTVTTPSPSNTTYYVWYTKDGVGTDPQPSVSKSLKIQVNVLSSDSIANVVTKTIIAINSKYFAVPDLRGLFLRGIDDGAGVDPDVGSRYIVANFDEDNRIGSFQTDQFFSHLHASGTLSGSFTDTDAAHVGSQAFAFIAGNNTQASNYPVTIAGSTAITGGNESRPVNVYVKWVVKY